jgi:DinB family protein
MTTTADTDYIRDLETTVDETAAWLRTVPDTDARWRPKSGAWSSIEIIGHLIDSAANNHTRFVRAAGQDDLVFPGYAQDDWVRAQNYAAAPWNEVITLWHSYNRHIARVMAAVPATVRYRKHERHNLHQLAWQPYAADEPATLDDLMRDYVLHLKHHLSQVRDRVRDAPTTGAFA